MIRDPFDIHRKNIFRETAARTAQHIRDTATQIGASNALGEMAFSMPRNVPNFGGADRDLEDSAWSSLRGGVQKGVSGLYQKKESLPMYKDKPYAYAPSHKNRPWWRRKRILGSICAFITLLVYFVAFRHKSQTEIRSSKSGWSWMGVSDQNKVDWEERREKVVEAFQLSWDSYERYAWGRCYISSLSPATS